MGGKRKCAMRSKNSVKPSNSSRSAELLLGSTSEFVTHTNFLVSPTSSMGSTEYVFDANSNSQLHVLIRKLAKKDPLTRKKALQELIEVLNDGDIEDIKNILPLWSKLYTQLACDATHNVRESVHMVQRLLALRCKRSMAPYLRRIVPVWLASHFDNYGPAASIANISFQETFGGSINRIPEVCLHCQSEILEYMINGILLNSVVTSNKQHSELEDTSSKDHKLFCCLKAISLFMESTKSVQLSEQSLQNIQKLVRHQNFWNITNHIVNSIKAAWFEFMCSMLENVNLENIMLDIKCKLLTVTFTRIKEWNPLVASQLWRCILLLQSNYIDWYEVVDLRKLVIPKLTSLFQNLFYNNATSICPNLLPFLTNICRLDTEWHFFCEQFFEDFKTAIRKLNHAAVIKKTEYSAILQAYYDCLQCFIEKLHMVKEEEKLFKLLNDNVIAPIEWSFNSENLMVSLIYKDTLHMVELWVTRRSQCKNKNNDESIFTKLFNEFWKSIIQLLAKYMTILEENPVDENLMKRMIELLQYLVEANERFFTMSKHEMEDGIDQNQEISKLGIKLVQFCVGNIIHRKSFIYIPYMHCLMEMFPNIEFYKNISQNGKVIESLNIVMDMLSVAGSNFNDILLDIIFDILQFVEKDQRLRIIKTYFIRQSKEIQVLVMNRLLSDPVYLELEVQTLLSEPDIGVIIVNLAKDMLIEKSFDNIKLIQKYISQINKSKSVDSTSTVDSLLNILSDPLDNVYDDEIRSICVAFFCDVMPNIFEKGTASKTVCNSIFINLFKLSVENTTNEFIIGETFKEITSIWMNAIYNKSVIIDENVLLQCKQIMDNLLMTSTGTNEFISNMACIVTQFILSLNKTTHPMKNSFRELQNIFLLPNGTALEAQKNLEEFCLFLEVLKQNVSSDIELKENPVKEIDIIPIFRQTLLNYHIIIKLLREIKTDPQELLRVENLDFSDNDVQNCLITEMLKCIQITAAGESFVKNYNEDNNAVELLVKDLSEAIASFWGNGTEFVSKLQCELIERASNDENISDIRSLSFLQSFEHYTDPEENEITLSFRDIPKRCILQNSMKAYIYSLQYLQLKINQPIYSAQSSIRSPKMPKFWMKCTELRCFTNIKFIKDENNVFNRNVITSILEVISEVNETPCFQKRFLYNVEILNQKFEEVIDVLEYIRLLIIALKEFPENLTIKNWDAIRIGLSSWALTVSKSIENYFNPKVSYFVVGVYKLFSAFMEFINSQSMKSSNAIVRDVIDEWDRLFKQEVNVILFKSFYNLCKLQDLKSSNKLCYILISEIQPTIKLLDFGIIYKFCKNSSKITLDDLSDFVMEGLSNYNYIVRVTCLSILQKLTHYFVNDDINKFDPHNESIEEENFIGIKHYLQRFEKYIGSYREFIEQYIKQFNFKTSEIPDFQEINRNIAISYLMLWDCIIHACAKSSAYLRSIYTTWLHENKYEEIFLHFLFRAMPVEILKNYDSKIVANEVFKDLTLTQITDKNLSLDRYVCHLYATILRKLPAVVRKWWSCSSSRSKTFVDKLTTNFVSPLIFTEELKSLASNKEKHENMQVTVHISTREVEAVYSIDEARMELIITLASNYPLGSVKVECGKQIGGRLLMRNIAMQLTLFLTHQNGTIFEGLSLWKNNLDKKFEGVEECYICYTVIHQDTCQLPKLTCKTCKKKFHGPCLYKWFTTSSKSTCPICRNIF